MYNPYGQPNYGQMGGGVNMNVNIGGGFGGGFNGGFQQQFYQPRFQQVAVGKGIGSKRISSNCK